MKLLATQLIIAICITLLLPNCAFNTHKDITVQAKSLSDTAVDHPKIKETEMMLPIASMAQGKKISNSIGMEFVYISPGTFIMGSPGNETGRFYDETQHKVTLTKGFYMQTTEVTQGQWKAVMSNNPSMFTNCGDNCPVESVSWKDIQDFIQKLNQRESGNRYRLPTEAEWEYAARAGSTSRYNFGNRERKLRDYAWYDDNSDNKTHPVAQKKPNAWGLYDIHGNVWEWCENLYYDYPTDSAIEPKIVSDSRYRMYRGGSWLFKSWNARSANRFLGWPSFRSDDIGFRLVRETSKVLRSQIDSEYTGNRTHSQ